MVGWFLKRFNGGGSVAEKKLRSCPLKQKKVVCDGLCKAVLDGDVPHLCPVFVKDFDLAVNCQ